MKKSLTLIFAASFSAALAARDIVALPGPADRPEVSRPELSGKALASAEAAAAFSMFLLDGAPDSKRALQYFAEAVDRDPQSPMLNNLALTLILRLNDPEFTGKIISAASKHPEALLLSMIAAEKLFLDRKSEEAAALISPAFEHRLSLDPAGTEMENETARAATLYSSILLNLKEFRKADGVLRDAADWLENKENPYLLQGELLFYNSARKEASGEALPLLGWLIDSDRAEFQKKYGTAERNFLRLAFEPENGLKMADFQRAAAVLAANGRPGILLEMAASGLLDSPGSSDSWGMLADYFQSVNDHVNAARARRLQLERSRIPNLRNRCLYAVALFQSGNYAAAAKEFDFCFLHGAAEPLLIHQAAAANFEIGNYEKALSLVNLLPRNLDTLNLAAVTLEKMNRHQEALDRVLEILRLEFKNTPRALKVRRDFAVFAAVLADKLGRIDLIERILEPELAVRPNDPELLNFLGYSLASAGIKLDKAEKLIRRALAANPKNPAVLDSLAWVLYRQGKFEAARAEIDRSLALEAQPDGVILDHAGDIYRALNRRGQALEFWNRALKNPGNELKPDSVRKKIQQIGK